MADALHMRVLDQDDWHELVGTDLEPILATLPADTRIVVVSTDDGAIVGTWAVIRYVHVEGLWIAPEHRKRGRVGMLLLAGMRTLARAWGTKVVLTGALSEDVRDLIIHQGGQPLPGEHFVMPIVRPRCR